MKSSDLKEYIINNECVDTILEELGCKNITPHVSLDSDSYYTCANPDGNNKNAVIVYLNENLTTINYTRNIIKDKRIADIFDLVSFYNDCSFPESLRYVHNILGLDYYKEPDDIPESLQILKMLRDMSIGDDEEEDNALVKPIPEEILSYYLPYGNKMFEDDGISLDIQREFEVSYCCQSNYITIPIRDGLGTLVGVKGRYFGEPDEYHPKYVYIEPCCKGRILYGYWQNKDYIKQNKYVYVLESEKAVQQLATIGVRSCVSTGGKTISKYQVEEIIRTGCTPIIAFDKDVNEEELQNIASMFMDGVTVYAIIDRDNILNEKESPSDDPQKWCHLVKNNIYKIKGGDFDG